MNIFFSACNSKFFKYALPLYSSFKKYNKETVMYFGNVDCTEEQLGQLEQLGVKTVNTDKVKVLKENSLSYNFLDWLIYDYLKDIDYNKVMWMDTDTTVTRNIEELFKIDADIIAHPGRDSKGAIMSTDGIMYMAFGTWVTRKKEFLKELSNEVKNLKWLDSESKEIRRLSIESGFKLHQLDPSIWNFSRQEVPKIERDEHGLYYKVYPATIGFSRDDHGKRYTNKIIEDWINENSI